MHALLFDNPAQPLVVADGMGSMAALIGMVRRRIRPDLILFADALAVCGKTLWSTCHALTNTRKLLIPHSAKRRNRLFSPSQ